LSAEKTVADAEVEEGGPHGGKCQIKVDKILTSGGGPILSNH